MAIDKEKLKHYAELLETEIDRLKGQEKDVHELADYDGLQRDIADAKAGRVSEPRWDHGLGRWVLDQSDIPGLQPLSSTLSSFQLLLRGWDLPGEKK